MSTTSHYAILVDLENCGAKAEMLSHIIERVNHEQLIAAHGKYYQLYTGAFELE